MKMTALGESVRMPSNNGMLPYQARWVDDESRVAIWEKSRRVGADFAEAFRSVRVRIKGIRNCDYWYSSADESAAFEQAVYVRLFLEMYSVAYREITETDLVDGKDMKVMTFLLPEVDGRRPRITVMTSSPRRFRSKGGDVTISELAFHQDPREMWKAAAMSTMWGGQLRVISSHNGEESFFNELLGQARRHIEPETYGVPRATDVKASVHRTTIQDAIDDGLVERVNETRGTDYTREGFLEEVVSKCSSQEVADEELGCKPSKQAGSYFPSVLTTACVAPLAPMPTEELGIFLEDISERAAEYDTLYAGADIARKNDRFVIAVLGKSGLRRDVLGMLVYHDKKFSVMETAIVGLMAGRFSGKAVRRISIDETGMGMQLAERMCDKFKSRAEGVTMTNPVKGDMFERLRVACEDRTIGLPDSLVLRADMAAIRREITKAGNIRYAAPKQGDGHSDRAVALALALVAAESASSPMRQVKVVGSVL